MDKRQEIARRLKYTRDLIKENPDNPQLLKELNEEVQVYNLIQRIMIFQPDAKVFEEIKNMRLPFNEGQFGFAHGVCLFLGLG